jgi:hypothetical protein
MPLRFTMYAQMPSSASPEPPIVIGRLATAVDADVAMSESKSPTLGSTAFASTMNDTP